MDLMEAMRARHSVRAFRDEPLSAKTVAALRAAVEEVNRESGFLFQLLTNEPEAFQANKPSYGSFRNCKNYFALAAPKYRGEKIGYYGEKLVLIAQSLGVNSCWVALTYKKGKADAQINAGGKLHMVIALGYGQTQGVPHKGKTAEDVSDCTPDSPAWYQNGVAAALLAPTALNQQKFRFTLVGDKVKAKAGLGFYTGADLGIVKYHFELGSGRGPDVWA